MEQLLPGGFVEGHVAWEDRQPAEVGSDQRLAEVARLARQLHDLTAGTPLAGPGDRRNLSAGGGV